MSDRRTRLVGHMPRNLLAPLFGRVHWWLVHGGLEGEVSFDRVLARR